MKKSIQIILTFAAVGLFIGIVETGVRENEKLECEQWQKESVEFRLWYATDWQIAQCQNYGIELKKFEPKKVYSGKVSWYNYSLDTNDQKCTENLRPCYSELNNTCASRDFVRGTILKVSLGNKSVLCRVNDYVENEAVILDLSSHAFAELADLKIGIIDVSIVVQ